MNMKMKVFGLFLSFSLSMSLLFLAADVHASGLTLTVTSNKPSYRLLPIVPLTINVGGNLTLNGVLASGGLVAVTVFEGKIGKYYRPVLFRTLATGPLPSQNWDVNLSVEVGTWSGTQFVPQSVFTCPSSESNQGPAFNVTFKNTASVPLMELYLALTIFDAAKVPITTMNYTISTPILAGQTSSIFFSSTALQSWVALGTATVYVSAFDSISHYDYFPYCPEASSQFTIVDASGSQTSSQENLNTATEQISSSIKGNYNLVFNLSYPQARPSYDPWGNYTVEVSSIYQGQQAINSYTFWVKVAGDVNGDGVVNLKDLTVLALNWLRTVPPAPAYADLAGVGIINLKDLTYVALTWLQREEEF
jgi:hypothetical protein